MIIRKEIDPNSPIAEDQRSELEKAAVMSASFDDDCPELTDEELLEFRKISDENRESRRKQTITIRLSAQAIRKARSLGKGYTSVLSRILETALNDNDFIRKFL